MSEKKLGRNHLSPWTLKEMEFIEAYYGKISAKEIGDKIGRSAGMVRTTARKLGLASPRPPTWTEEELSLIRDNYGKGIAFVRSLLPERTEYAIRIQASLMRVANSSWSEEERQYLKTHHGNMPIARIAAELGRTVSGVAGMVTEMGLRKKPVTTNEPWTDRELDILRTHYGARGWISRVQALLPGRTKGTISVQANKLGIQESQAWLPDEIKILQEFYPKSGPCVAEMLPGRTVAAIKTQARRQGLKLLKNTWTSAELALLEENISLSVTKLMDLFPERTRNVLGKLKRQLKNK